MNQTKYVAYTRVSTQKQGRSGLGLDAQKAIIEFYSQNGDTIAEFQEVYTGTDLQGCSELWKAIDFAKANKAKLILAKSDRFRNVKEALEILDKMGEGNLICCDIPNADRFTYTIFFAIAEREALNTSIRTKAALKQSKIRGVNSGKANSNYGSRPEHQERMAIGNSNKGKTKTRTTLYSEKVQAFIKICYKNISKLSEKSLKGDDYFLNWDGILVHLDTETINKIKSDMVYYHSDIFTINELTNTWIYNRYYSLIRMIKKYNELQVVND